MSKESSSSSSGVSAVGLLGVAFVVLKLCGIINWSWWWVTAPFWGGVALILAVLLVIGVVVLPAKAYSAHRRKQRDLHYKEPEILEEQHKPFPERKSKFMERLEEAMKASEEAKRRAGR